MVTQQKELCSLRCWLCFNRCTHFLWAFPIHTYLYYMYGWHCVLWSHDLSVMSWHSVSPCFLIQEAKATQRKQGRPVQEEDSQTGDWPEGAPGGRDFGSKIWWLWWWTQRKDRGKHQRNVSVSEETIYSCMYILIHSLPTPPLLLPPPLSPSLASSLPPFLFLLQEWTKGKTVSYNTSLYTYM